MRGNKFYTGASSLKKKERDAQVVGRTKGGKGGRNKSCARAENGESSMGRKRGAGKKVAGRN